MHLRDQDTCIAQCKTKEAECRAYVTRFSLERADRAVSCSAPHQNLSDCIDCKHAIK